MHNPTPPLCKGRCPVRTLGGGVAYRCILSYGVRCIIQRNPPVNCLESAIDSPAGPAPLLSALRTFSPLAGKSTLCTRGPFPGAGDFPVPGGVCYGVRGWGSWPKTENRPLSCVLGKGTVLRSKLRSKSDGIKMAKNEF